MPKVKKEQITDGKLECTMAKRGLWLVKVPKYLSLEWQQQAGNEVGKVMMERGAAGNATGRVYFQSNAKKTAKGTSGNAPKVVVSSGAAGIDLQPLGRPKPNAGKDLPDKHQFVMNTVDNLSLALYSEDKRDIDETEGQKSGRLNLEGRIVRRAECRPPTSNNYMKMKISQIEKASKPKSSVQQMEKAAVKFKPVAIHSEDVVREKIKKSGIKAVRADKDKVRNLLFEAFEKHQYYRLVDLANLTRQPPGYIKELLNEIAVYNTAPPHKAMWELKPEYRAYQVKEEEEMSDS